MSVQRHIHLDATLGGAPENAPLLKWRVLEHTMTPLVAINVEYTRQFYLREQVLKSVGTPVLLKGYTLKLLIFNEDPDDTQDQLDDLITMVGQRVYFVDNNHPDDGADHTSMVQTVLMGKIDSLTAEDPLLRLYYPVVTLHPVRS